VLYVAAEGERGIARRLTALADEYSTTDAFHLISQRADLLHGSGSNSDLDALTKAAHAAGAGLIVIDTLARTMAGGDENSSQDMGTFISNVTDLRDATDAHILIVHHGTKASNGTSPRGHSSLAGAVDAIVEVTKAENGDRLACITAAKDDADGADMGFRLRLVDLGQDADGDPITTLLVEELASAPHSGPRLTQFQRGVQNAVINLMAAHGMPLPRTTDFPTGVNGVRESDVLAECEARHLSAAAEPKRRRQSYREALVHLQGVGKLVMRHDWVWLP
jgi:hypothetical protein